jgi:hypothetical protein
MSRPAAKAILLKDLLTFFHLEKGVFMLFMSVFSCSPEKRDESIDRWLKESTIPSGVKLLGEWPVIGKNKVYRLYETNDPAAMLKSTSQWSDIGEILIEPVMKSEEMKELFKNMKK